MSLREDMQKYEQITGESAEHVPIIRIGSVLDGYEIAMKERRVEMVNRSCDNCIYTQFVDDICDFMTVRANQKERENRKGFCDHEVVGFVHGVRWCVSIIKNNKNLLEYVNKEIKKNEKK